MTRSKSTKRALLTSVLALLMCVTMLIGTTFAWFTDTASTGVNKITSGNLHVEIQDKEGREIDTLKWVDKDGNDIANQDDILWEPGCTYLLTPFQIVNTGNLSLKYKIVITGLDGDSPLLDVIKFTYKTANGGEFDMSAEGHLTAKGTPGASTGMITVSAHMDELANNDYMDKTLTGIKFTVYATQDTVENDSFDNQYDKDAQYPDVDVVTVTPDTIPSPFKADTAYFFEAGNYGDQHFVITDKENVTLIGKTGAKFDSLQISSIDYVNPSIGQEVDLDNSTLTVKGFEVAKTLMIVEADKNVVVEDNTAAQITVKANLSSQSIAVNNNIITGGDGAANSYGVYIVPNVTDYDLTVTGNSFTNVKSHAISVQGCGDGSAVTAAKSITVTDNTFTSYGTNNKTGRAAFKIWEDTKLAPNGTDPLNDAAKALAKTVKENNYFAAGLGENCVVADFYGKTVAFN